MTRQSILKELEWRGLIAQTSNREGLEAEVQKNSITLYQGFDPTADSLHIGNLLGLLTLKRFQEFGHKPIILVGGMTGLIGDPGGRTSERQLNTETTVAEWTKKILKQVQPFLDFKSKSNGAKLLNNYDWLSKTSLIQYLREVGKRFNVNEMIDKEIISTRLREGISYTEFSYQILQSMDCLELFNKHNCILQIGGTDQWGNISAGVSFVRKSLGKEVFALTMPLVTTKEGKKFGKSEGNAVWLDAKKTSPYHFYQFWINCDDSDVIKLLKLYTFLTEAEIGELENELKNNPEKREAHKRLAGEVTKLVHGAKGLEEAKRLTDLFFSGNFKSITKKDAETLKAGRTAVSLEFGKTNLVDCLVLAKISDSRRQAKEDIENGAISINGEVIKNADHVMNETDSLQRQIIIIRRGKKDFHILPL